jgi:hypothetical protein
MNQVKNDQINIFNNSKKQQIIEEDYEAESEV